MILSGILSIKRPGQKGKKNETALVYAMKAYRESRGTVPLIFILGAISMWVITIKS